MEKLKSSFIASGSMLILSGLVYLLADLHDRAVKFAMPVILTGIVILAVHVFMSGKSDVLKYIKR